jgi:hypothetical protein
VGKTFTSQQAVEKAFDDFIVAQPPDFYSSRIKKLPIK